MERTGHVRMLALDLEQNCIVEMAVGEPYVALSYQWGGDQKIKLLHNTKQGLMTPGSLRTDKLCPSKTIEDAMKVTKILGYRYLWVDALCILQDDVENIQMNVGQMDRIYTDSVLTIVAAAGQDANYGLPGVSRPRDQVQMRVKRSKNSKITIANTLASEMDAINFTRWNTRGWTYQERLLSSRLLTFTSSQIYFACNSGCEAREDVHIGHASETTAVMSLFDHRYELDLVSRNVFEVYGVALAEYTGRNLFDPRDRVKAFTGLLTKLEKLFEGPCIFGLPTTLFDIALLWYAAGSSTRVDLFPSWSWAGWSGAVRYALKDSMMNFGACTVSMATIEVDRLHLCDDLSRRECASEQELQHHDAYTRYFDEDTLEIYYRERDVDGTENTTLYPRPITGKLDSGFVSMNDAQTLALRVTGLTAKFKLTGEHSYAADAFSTCKQGQHKLCDLAVYDARDRYAGVVYVDGSLVPSVTGAEQRFLALSRSTLYRNDIDRAWDDEGKHFRHWSHPLSRETPFHTESDDEDAGWFQRQFGGPSTSQGKLPFDVETYNKNIYWPINNVLLLSSCDGEYVERVGIGKIHVDAFLPVAKREHLLLW